MKMEPHMYSDVEAYKDTAVTSMIQAFHGARTAFLGDEATKTFVNSVTFRRATPEYRGL